MAMTRVLGIDPASLTGIAWESDGFWCRATVDANNETDMLSILKWAKDDGVTHAVIEDCFLGPKVTTYKLLARIQERWEHLCHSVGITTELVNPTTWKRAMLTIQGYYPKKRKEQKRVARWVARNVYKVPVINDDEADAVCIAAWGMAQRKGNDE
jgi:hypothetical protein